MHLAFANAVDESTNPSSLELRFLVQIESLVDATPLAVCGVDKFAHFAVDA